MTNALKSTTVSRMQKTLDALQGELTKLRTGRAHPSLLEHITVDYYGTETQLKSVASITVSDASTLTISPWEKSMVSPIEKAILSSDLGLNPAATGDVIRVPLPPLSEERRRELVRLVKHEAEQTKVAIRNIRRDANHHLKEQLKAKTLSEDDLRRAEDSIQKLTDDFIGKVDGLASSKENELMKV